MAIGSPTARVRLNGVGDASARSYLDTSDEIEFAWY
jgi:hypothetical protein